MRDDRALVALGDLVDINPREEPLREDAPFIPMDAVSDGCSGVIRYVEERGSRGGPRFRSGDTLFARITPCLENGKVALVPESIERGSGSTEFLVLRPKAGILPQFVFILSTWGSLRREAARLMTGTSGRQRLSGADLGKLLVPALSLEEQRRIVDLISSIDHAIDSLDDLEERKNTTALSITSSLFSAVDFGDTPIRDLLETSIGGVWGGEPGTSEVDVRVYRSTDFNPDGALTIEGGVTRSITKRQLLSRRLQAGDILLEKSGGGPNQPVGRVALVPEHAEVAVCANFVQLLRPDKSKVDPIYLWGLLWWWHATGRTQVFQRRTTGIRNLQTTAYLEQKVTLPPLEEQQKVASLLRKVDAGRRSTRELRFRLADLRSSLIANLLSGAHEIPDSYDRFLEETS